MPSLNNISEILAIAAFIIGGFYLCISLKPYNEDAEEKNKAAK